MTAEFIAIIAVGIGVAALTATLGSLLLATIHRIATRPSPVEAPLSRVEYDSTEWRRNSTKLNLRLDRIDVQLDALASRMSAMEQRQAHLGGVLDGLREAMFGRAPAGP